MANWLTFYEIVGCAGATLISVQFVVIALLANLRRHAEEDAINAFGTPTIVHFGCALLLAGVMTAHWPTMSALATAVGVGGVVGLAYNVVVFRRALRQTVYVPVAEDWIWFVVLPAVMYAALLVAAVLLCRFERTACFLIGGIALCLLYIGVHNAWDTVVHLVSTDEKSAGERKSS